MKTQIVLQAMITLFVTTAFAYSKNLSEGGSMIDSLAGIQGRYVGVVQEPVSHHCEWIHCEFDYAKSAATLDLESANGSITFSSDFDFAGPGCDSKIGPVQKIHPARSSGTPLYLEFQYDPNHCRSKVDDRSILLIFSNSASGQPQVQTVFNRKWAPGKQWYNAVRINGTFLKN